MTASDALSHGATGGSGSLATHKALNASTTSTEPALSTTFLRSVGLKVLTLRHLFTLPAKLREREEEKILVSPSRKIASVRVAVHILPTAITIFLILFNALEFLNGPQITATATFFLQLAAKFHELTISGSLTLIVVDVVRYELLREGINLGLLASGYTFTSLNLLWSPGFWTFLLVEVWSVRKLCLFLIITVCCVMTAIVGPASALLCIPTYTWKPSGWSEFYLGGNDEDHWPSQLTARHAGPDFCLEFDTATKRLCAAGGYDALRSRLLWGPNVVFDIPMFDGGYSHIIHGRSPDVDPARPQMVAQESWVMVPRLDTMDMLQDLNNAHRIAQFDATGRNRRLTNFGDGAYIISASKVVVGRTVCGPPRVINESTTSVEFPVLPADRRWQSLTYETFTQGQWGPLLDHRVGGLHDYNGTSATKSTQVRAKWVNLGSEYGAATAGVAIITQNSSTMISRGCTLDYRWADGQTFRGSNSELNSFEPQIGPPTHPTDSQNSYQRANMDFSDPQTVPHVGATIKANEDWLNAAFPVHVLSSETDGYNMTTLEAILDGATDLRPEYAFSDNVHIVRAFGQLTHTEHIITVLFADALSRTGWHLSLDYDSDQQVIDPQFLQSSRTHDQWQPLLLRGGNIYLKPENISYISMKATWHSYGVAWTLDNNGQFLAVTVLAIHILLAAIHSLLVIWTSRSMDAWDTVTELLLLAWNSVPTRRDREFTNCSVGVYGVHPFESKVKAMVVEDRGEFQGRVELVVVDGGGTKGDEFQRRRLHDVQPGWTYR